MAFIKGSTVGGLGSLMGSIAVAEGSMFVSTSQGLEGGRKTFESKVRENISKTCHSLKELADMGHPYSVVNPNNPHPEKPYLVHQQTGNLLSSVRSGTRPNEVWVGIDESVAPYARVVLFGGPRARMFGRDFLSGSRDEIKGEVAAKMKAGVVKALAIVSMFYMLAHYAKWASKFVGGSPVASRMYKYARIARNVEVISQGQPYGLSRRLVNITMAGPIAKQFMIPGAGPARVGGAVVNKFIMKEYGNRLFKAF